MAARSGDRAVLVEFYNATNGANWTNNTNRNSSSPLHPSEETLRRDLRMQFTLGREQWLEQGAGYRLALTLLSGF